MCHCSCYSSSVYTPNINFVLLFTPRVRCLQVVQLWAASAVQYSGSTILFFLSILSVFVDLGLQFVFLVTVLFYLLSSENDVLQR